MAVGQESIEVPKTRKGGSASSIGGNGSRDEAEVISSMFTSQFAATVNTQTVTGGMRPATLIAIFNLTLGQTDSAVSLPVELQDEKDMAVDCIPERESEQVEVKANVSCLEEQFNTLRANKESVSAEVTIHSRRNRIGWNPYRFGKEDRIC